MWLFKSIFKPIYGLIEVNVRAYFHSRLAGNDHQGALQRMVETRYSPALGDKDKRDSLLAQLAKVSQIAYVDDLKEIIFYMYTFEVGPPPPVKQVSEFFANLDKTIEKYRRKYPTVILSDKKSSQVPSG